MGGGRIRRAEDQLWIAFLLHGVKLRFKLVKYNVDCQNKYLVMYLLYVFLFIGCNTDRRMTTVLQLFCYCTVLVITTYFRYNKLCRLLNSV